MWYFFLRSIRPVERWRANGRAIQSPVLSQEEAGEFERIRVKIETQGPQALNPKERVFLDKLRERVMRAGDD